MHVLTHYTYTLQVNLAPGVVSFQQRRKYNVVAYLFEGDIFTQVKADLEFIDFHCKGIQFYGKC